MELISHFQRIEAKQTALIAAWSALALGVVIVISLATVPVAKRYLAVAGGNNSFVAVPDVPNTGSAPAAAAAATMLKAPLVTFSFRDGFDSAYFNALPLFDAKEWKVSYSVIPTYLGYSGYVNQAQLNSVEKRGHEVLRGENGSAALSTEFVVGPETTIADIQEVLDDAVDNDTWVRIVLYRVNESKTHDGKNASLQMVKEVIRLVENRGIRVVTFEEGTRIVNLGD